MMESLPYQIVKIWGTTQDSLVVTLRDLVVYDIMKSKINSDIQYVHIDKKYYDESKPLSLLDDVIWGIIKDIDVTPLVFIPKNEAITKFKPHNYGYFGAKVPENLGVLKYKDTQDRYYGLSLMNKLQNYIHCCDQDFIRVNPSKAYELVSMVVNKHELPMTEEFRELSAKLLSETIKL